MRELIDSGVTRILQDHCTAELIAACARGHWPARLWALLEASGFTRALCQTDNGGSEATWEDVHPLLVASGQHSLPLPLPETLFGNYLLELAGLPLAEGPVGLADASDALHLRAEGANWLLSGRIGGVPWGRHCDCIVAQVAHEGRNLTVRLDARGLKPSQGLNLAREPRDSYELRDQPVAVGIARGDVGSTPRLLGAYMRAAQTAGACQAALEQAARYAGERSQFGRTLSKFQAIQHQVASAVSETAAVFAAVEQVSHAAGLADARWNIAVAKITAAEAASKAAAVAHAVHGAIGFTQEHPLHFATQRLWSWRSEYGNIRWWSELLGRAVCRGGAHQAWAALIEPNVYLDDRAFQGSIVRGLVQPS